MGFIRAKRLYRFYLNASDAFRLILPLEPSISAQPAGSESAEAVLQETDSEDEESEYDGRYNGINIEDRLNTLYS